MLKNDPELLAIIKRIAEHDDPSAFRQLFLKFSPNLISYAFSITGSQEASEDIIQDVFLKIWNNRILLTSVENISYYLLKAVKNTSLNYLSAKNRNVLPLQEEVFSDTDIAISLSPAETFISKQNLELINKAISQLPPRSRLLLQLIKIEGLKYKEAAELLDISVKTVETYMTTAYTQLINAIEQAIPEYKNLYQYKRQKSN